MSSEAAGNESEAMMFCASCGTAGGDDIKLKKCTACHLVRYCSVKCQKDHRKQHKKECKKRAAELKDEILFKQPEGSCFGDCPICCLPLPIDPEKLVLMACCGKTMCKGCLYENQRKDFFERRLQIKCPFCRTVPSNKQEDVNERLLKRIEANDPVAMCQMGALRCEDDGDYEAALDYWTKAAALGYALAHYELSTSYREGQGVQKDEKKFLYHLEQAAIGGHPGARFNLGLFESKNRRVDRAVKHWIIGANLGHDLSLENIQDLYKRGHVSKEDFTAALRGYQAAIAATKSPQREAAYEFTKRNASVRKM